MAGEFPVPARPSSGRKQWKLYRGHRGPFRRLGTEIAEDDCPDSQVMYARQLLEEKCDDDVDQEENARLGVYWLLKASEQGHQEATRMLHQCLETGRGISEHNIGDVKSCLDMSLGEKVSRHAAREMFASLSQGENYITSDQLSEEMLRVQVRGHSSKEGSEAAIHADRHHDWKGRMRLGMKTERLTEEMVVAAGSHYSRGVLPVVDRVVCVGRAGALAPYRRVVTSLASRPLVPPPPVALALLLLHSLLGTEGLVRFLPTVTYYVTLFLTLLTTCRVLSKKWESNKFKQWSRLLVAWGGPGVNPSEAQWCHCLNNMRPCFLFFMALLGNLSAAPFVPPVYVPHSELAVLSTFTALLLLYNFMWREGKLDMLLVVSFGIHVIARYPYDADTVVSRDWRFLDVHAPTLASYVIGTGIEFCLNFRLVFYVGLVITLVKLASRDGWRGLLTTLVPHLVCLSWWQMAVIASNGATWYGLIRACLGLFGIVLFIPVAGFSAVILPIVAFIKSLFTVNLLPLPLSVVVAIVSIISALYFSYKNSSTSSHLSWLQVGVVVVSCWVVGWAGEGWPAGEGPAQPSVSWAEYRAMCPPEGPLAQPSLPVCSSLAGLHVSWEASLLSTSVKAVHNPLATLVSYLPRDMMERVSCLVGEKYEECSGGPGCRTAPSLKDKCHLANWNRYEFELVVSVSSGGLWEGRRETAVVRAGHSFTNLTLSLSVGDRLWVSGVVAPQPSPTIILTAAGCLSCTHPVPTASPATPPHLPSLALPAARSTLRFLLGPLLPFN